MQCNKIISPVNFVLSKQAVEQETDQVHQSLKVIASGNSKTPAHVAQASASLEVYLRRMISHCALKLAVPTYSYPGLATPQSVKQLLTPSIRARISFVDRRGTIWNALVAYFEPLTQDVAKGQEPTPLSFHLSYLAWQFYLLVLATKQNAEAIVSPEKALDAIAELQDHAELSRESRARLAIIAGLFNSFSQPIDSASLRLLPACSAKTILERVSEILEDAYLMEASHLRRRLGMSHNRASIQRELRRLLGFIKDHRPWAKGIVDVGSQTLLGVPAVGTSTEAVLNIIPQLATTQAYPVLVSENIYFDQYLNWRTEVLFSTHRYIAGGWISYARVQERTYRIASRGEPNNSMKTDR